jgi:hypothetical protein
VILAIDRRGGEWAQRSLFNSCLAHVAPSRDLRSLRAAITREAARATTGGDAISEAANTALWRLLLDHADARTVYPTLSTDGEGGLFAEWLAGGERLTVVVDEAGQVDLLGMHPGEKMRQLSVRNDFRSTLARISDTVWRMNPAWRNAFESA